MRKSLFDLIARSFLGLMLLLTGCGEDGGTTTEEEEQEQCAPGTLDCICAEGASCLSEDLFCAGGYCRQPTCRIGDEDCACFANLTCNVAQDGRWLVCDSGLCREPACTPGELGCGCNPDNTCDDGLSCSSASGNLRCEVPDCEIGDRGCGCFSNRTCNPDPDTGGELICFDGQCLPPSCERGARDCACFPNFSCDPGLVCSDDSCQPIDCQQGDLGCGCNGDGSCNSATLYCAGDGTCQAVDCPQGDENCGCFADFSCSAATESDTILLCETGRCVARAADSTGVTGAPCYPNDTCNYGNSCVDDDVCAACLPGTTGCSCFGNDSCTNGLICAAGRCLAEDDPVALDPPDDPKCYTPCSEGLELSNGQFLPCDADGLMEFCPTGTACTDGTCLAPGQPTPTCQNDLDCPDFKTCIASACYSNCELNADCSAGRACHRHVCRVPCSASGAACGAGLFCDATDGEFGFCMPLRDPDANGPGSPIPGDFVLSETYLSFTNTSPTGSFEVTNNAPTSLEFTVRKAAQREFTPGGVVTITQNPLTWVELGAPGNTALTPYTFVLASGASRVVEIAQAADSSYDRWEGTLEVEQASLGVQRVNLSYASTPDGQWKGNMYYLADFPEGPNLETWIASSNKNVGTLNIENALVQRWTDFRRGLTDIEEFKAVLTATQIESWRWASVRELSPSCDTDAGRACYLNDSPQGYAVYTDRPEIEVPADAMELPVAFNLAYNNSNTLNGKIVSGDTLHYAGDPAVSLTFASDPTNPTDCSGGTCKVFVSDFGADIYVGGHFHADDQTGCSNGFEKVDFPWLVDGFFADATYDPASATYTAFACRDSEQPFGAGSVEEQVKNLNLALSNPVPNGLSMQRQIEFIDGVLINQSDLFILFRERFDSFLGVDDSAFFAYGYLWLQRTPANLEADDYAGTNHSDARPLTEASNAVLCDPDLVEDLLGPTADIDNDAADAEDMIKALIEGVVPSATPPATIDPNDPDPAAERVHYLCEDTGLFDQGSDPNAPVACPPESNVEYFTVKSYANSSSDPTNIAHEICQLQGTCRETLDRWYQGGSFSIRAPLWRCAPDADGVTRRVFCDDNRLDLRADKEFYSESDTVAVFLPLQAAIESAFRYKTRFQNREGTGLGFTPEICLSNGSFTRPYCYSPKEIQDLLGRVDCLTYLYDRYVNQSGTPALTPAIEDALRSYLRGHFASIVVPSGSLAIPLRDEGFEWLYSELLVMLGDESYTDAFASRFDLAGSRTVFFDGTRFEPNGLELSGGAGFEMANLYRATQYYQLVLDRFLNMGPYLWREIARQANAGAEGYIKQDIVPSYFARAIRASAQKARAWSAIAERYQSFNRPDLARAVIERAYAATYLESVILSRMMLRLIDGLTPSQQDLVRREFSLSQIRYRAELLNMREVYSNITDEINYFGFTADYIPFPGLQPSDPNAFEVVLSRAWQKLQVAEVDENEALATSRTYETDSAAFQSELAKIRSTYENQLGDICGTFIGTDSRVYPAIPRYAALHPDETIGRLGNPCGFLGNGALNDAMAQLEIADLDFQSVIVAQQNLEAEVAIEVQRVNDQCGLTYTMADYAWNVENESINLQTSITNSRFAIDKARRDLETVQTVTEMIKCTVGLSTDCPTASIASVIFSAASAAIEQRAVANEVRIAEQEERLARLRQQLAYNSATATCDAAEIDSQARIESMLLRSQELELQAIRAQYSLRLSMSNIDRLRQQALRLADEQAETEELLINVEAARNNPNVRIYKNDAILNADRTFYSAIREAYRATRLFEYYTSQSYARRDELLLTRMVAHGDFSLESYLAALDEAFFEFEENFGIPDTRVAVISLRDHIFRVPRTDAQTGQPMSQRERVDAFRVALQNVTLLDERGYITVPFSTGAAQLSPLTRNHKVLYVEAEIIGSDVGDGIGRVYLHQRGTGVVRPVAGDQLYYAFPDHLAVINTFFNGQRLFTPEVYRNNRLRDLPFINTYWEVIFNQRDEVDNADIDLASLTDIRLYIYYTDFTQL